MRAFLLFALALGAGAPYAVDEPMFEATAQVGRYGLQGGDPRGVRVRLEVRGGAAADALAVRKPNVQSAEDDRGRPLEAYEPPTWEEPVEYEVVDRSAPGVPEGGAVVVFHLAAADGDVKSIEVQGTLPLLSGGTDVALRFPKFQGKKARKLKHRALAASDVSFSVRTESRPGLLFEVVSAERRVQSVRLVDERGEHAHGIDWQGLSNAKLGHLVVHTEDAKPPKGMFLEVELDGVPEPIVVRDARGDKKGRELSDPSLADAGVVVTARIVERPILRMKIEGEAALVHSLRLEAKGVPIAASPLEYIDVDQTGEVIWIYDAPWPKEAVLVGSVRQGGAWSEVPFTLSDVAVD